MLGVVAPDPVIQRVIDRFWEKNQGDVELLDARCQPTQLPDVAALPEQHTVGCGGQTMVKWWYWGNADEEMHALTACVVCDRVYDYPRFA